MHAFVTFEHSESLNHSLELFSKKDNGLILAKGDAPLPADIKWNARNKVSRNERITVALTYLMIGVVLVSLMSLIITIRYYSQMLVTPFQ